MRMIKGNILIACVDDDMGMVFNGRRVSRDVEVCKDVLKLCAGGCLHMDAGTFSLFQELETDGVKICDMDGNSLTQAVGDVVPACGTDCGCVAYEADDGVKAYFVERPEQLSLFRWDGIVLYHWNRIYPSDGSFDLDLTCYELRDKTEFQGSSHEKITREWIKMSANSDEKTNVCRVLEQKKIPYKLHMCEGAENLSGDEIAARLGENPDQAFKTLVTVGKSGKNYVFVVPVSRELDLKKAARAVSEKSIEMIKSRELLPLTGYVHGGCSPIGMKKAFPTVIDSTVGNFETFMFSAGKIGCQVEVSCEDLKKVIRFEVTDLVRE